jgi:hypothetical protein
VAALIAKWREWSAWEANECSNWERATTLDQCADELEALIGRLPVPPSAPPPLQVGKYLLLVDGNGVSVTPLVADRPQEPQS